MTDEKLENLIPKLDALLKLWRRRYGTRPIPKSSLLTAEELQPWSRNIALIEHGTDGRFHVRTFGIDLIRRFGRESTGQCVDELARDIRESLQSSLQRCHSIGAPVTARTSVNLGRDAAQFDELVLPLTSTVLLFAAYERIATNNLTVEGCQPTKRPGVSTGPFCILRARLWIDPGFALRAAPG
jgi:hypothetical protein